MVIPFICLLVLTFYLWVYREYESPFWWILVLLDFKLTFLLYIKYGADLGSGSLFP